MTKTLKELTNIGIPCYSDIKLPLYDMTLDCANDKQKTIGIERNMRKEAIDRVDRVIETKSLSTKRVTDINNLNFFANDNSISIIDISKGERFNRIFYPVVDLDNTPSNRKIKTTEETLELLKEKADYPKKHPYSSEYHSSLKEQFNLIYNGRKYGYNLQKYLENEYNHYLEKFARRKELLRIDYSDLMEEYIDCLNPEKTALFIAYCYLEEIKTAMVVNDISRIQECLFYLTAFLKNKIDKSIKLDKKTKIDYDYINKEYNSLLKQYPKLRELDYKRDLFENKDIEDNKRVIDRLVNIEKIIVPFNFVKKGEELKIEISDGTHKRKNNPPTPEELKQIQEYLDYKHYVFLKHNPIAQIECPNKFSNYIAFLYENGMMPADRFNNVNTIGEMKADSIYIFDDLTYEEMMQYNKPYLRKNSEIKPLNHSGDWESRVADIATRKTTQEMEDKAKQMVKNKTN